MWDCPGVRRIGGTRRSRQIFESWSEFRKLRREFQQNRPPAGVQTVGSADLDDLVVQSIGSFDTIGAQSAVLHPDDDGVDSIVADGVEPECTD